MCFGEALAPAMTVRQFTVALALAVFTSTLTAGPPLVCQIRSSIAFLSESSKAANSPNRCPNYTFQSTFFQILFTKNISGKPLAVHDMFALLPFGVGMNYRFATHSGHYHCK